MSIPVFKCSSCKWLVQHNKNDLFGGTCYALPTQTHKELINIQGCALHSDLQQLEKVWE